MEKQVRGLLKRADDVLPSADDEHQGTSPKTKTAKPETDDEFEDVEIEETPDDDRQAPRHEPNAEAPAEVPENLEHGQKVTAEVKGLREFENRREEDMCHNAPWRSRGKGHGYSSSSKGKGERERAGKEREDRERDLLSFGSNGSDPDFHGLYKHVVVNFDTGAAVSTSGGEPHNTRYKTASGELFEDHGQVRLYGSDQNYTDKTMNARVTDVHRILASGSEVCKKNMVVLDSEGGQISPGNSNAAKRIHRFVNQVLREEECKSTKMRIEKGVYVFDYDQKTTGEKASASSGN